MGTKPGWRARSRALLLCFRPLPSLLAPSQMSGLGAQATFPTPFNPGKCGIPRSRDAVPLSKVTQQVETEPLPQLSVLQVPTQHKAPG